MSDESQHSINYTSILTLWSGSKANDLRKAIQQRAATGIIGMFSHLSANG